MALTARTPEGAQNDFEARSVAVAAPDPTSGSGGGSGGAAVAGSVAVQVLQLRNEAVIGEGSTLQVAGDLTLHATNPMGLQAMAVSAAASMSGSGVGAGIVVQFVDADTLAYIDSSFERPTIIEAGGAIIGRAAAHLHALAAPDIGIDFIDIPDFTGVALGAALGGGDAGVGGSVIVNVTNRSTGSWLGEAAQVNQTIGVTDENQHLAFSASDQTEFVDLAGALGLTTGSAGVGFALVVGVHNKDVRATIGEGVAARPRRIGVARRASRRELDPGRGRRRSREQRGDRRIVPRAGGEQGRRRSRHARPDRELGAEPHRGARRGWHDDHGG